MGWTRREVLAAAFFLPRLASAQEPEQERFDMLVEQYIAFKEELQAVHQTTTFMRKRVFQLEESLRTRGEAAASLPEASLHPRRELITFPDHMLSTDTSVIHLSPANEYAASYTISVDMTLGNPAYGVARTSPWGVHPVSSSFLSARFPELNTALEGSIARMEERRVYFDAMEEYLVREQEKKWREKPIPASVAQKIKAHADDYAVLRSVIQKPEEWRYALHVRNLHYPLLGSTNFEQDIRRSYGNPLTTHQNRHGVCDEFAVHFAGIFAGKKGYEVYLVAMSREHPDPAGRHHAVSVFRTPQNEWGFTSNNFLSSCEFSRMDDAVLSAMLLSGYEPEKSTLWTPRKVPPSGGWLVNDRESAKLSP